MTDHRPVRVGVALALAAASSYGVTVVVGRDLASAGVDGATALAVRFGSSALILVGFQLVRGRSIVPPRGERAPAFLLGAVGYAVESSSFYAALGRGSAAAVTMLFYSYPAIVAVSEMALGRLHPSRRLFAALALTIGGGALIVSAGDEVAISPGGVAFALAAACAFTAYLLCGERFARTTEAPVKAMWVAFGASCSLSVRAIATGAELPPTSRALELLAYGVANAGAFALMFAALGRIGPTRTAVVLTFELVATVVLAALLLDEGLTATHLIGGVAVLGGAVLAALLPHARPVAQVPSNAAENTTVP